MTDINHALDIEATQAIIKAGNTASLRNVCYGVGAVILGTGLAIASCLWATHQGTNPDDIRAVLEHMDLKVDVAGNVTMTDGVVSLKDGSTVGVVGNLPVQQTIIPQVKDAPEGIKREVTVFSQVKVGQNEDYFGYVITGWEFNSSADRTPHRQFCYYTITAKNRTSVRVELAATDSDITNTTNLQGFDEYKSKCVWFKHGDV